MAAPTPCLSFIGIVDFSEKARWLFMTDSVTDLLGFEPQELIGRSSLELVHPDEFPRVKQLHYDTIQQDKAAVLVYLRMKHKDPFRGYVLCGVSRTVVHNVLVGSVSFASPGAKALHNASTAQEITVITPSAANFEFRRWHDPSPMPPSPIPEGMATISSITIPPLGPGRTPPSPSPSTTSSWGAASNRSPPLDARRLDSQSPPPPPPPPPPRRRPRSYSVSSSISAASEDLDLEERMRSPSPTPRRGSGGDHYERDRERDLHHERDRDIERTSPAQQQQTVITFPHLPSKSFRTAFILDRFSTHCAILYASNDLLISSSAAIGRSFFDFVEEKDEEVVRSWITCVKGWGVNEKGQPSDGGFGFGKFMVCAAGRESVARMPDPQPTPRSRNRHGSQSSRAAHHQAHHPTAHGQRPGRYAAARGQTHHTTSDTHGRRLTVSGGVSRVQPQDEGEKFEVDAIFSAHSDGLMVILRRAS